MLGGGRQGAVTELVMSEWQFIVFLSSGPFHIFQEEDVLTSVT